MKDLCYRLPLSEYRYSGNDVVNDDYINPKNKYEGHKVRFNEHQTKIHRDKLKKKNRSKRKNK